MKLDDLPPHLRIAFIAVSQSAIGFIENEMTLEEFLKFAKGVWETIELNGTEAMKDSIQHIMFMDIHKFTKEADKD